MFRKFTSYLLFTLNRAFSGVVNGLNYSGAKRAMLNWVAPLYFLFTGFTVLFPALKNWKHMGKRRRRWVVAGLFATFLTTILLFVAMTTPAGGLLADLHLWTFLNQTAITGSMWLSGVRASTLLLAVEPACFLQKTFVNIVPGGSMWSSATDVASGRSWSMPSLGIKVPRIGNMAVKGLIALACIAIFTVKSCKEVKREKAFPPKGKWETRPVVLIYNDDLNSIA